MIRTICRGIGLQPGLAIRLVVAISAQLEELNHDLSGVASGRREVRNPAPGDEEQHSVRSLD